jgi:hypothetical protein
MPASEAKRVGEASDSWSSSASSVAIAVRSLVNFCLLFELRFPVAPLGRLLGGVSFDFGLVSAFVVGALRRLIFPLFPDVLPDDLSGDRSRLRCLQLASLCPRRLHLKQRLAVHSSWCLWSSPFLTVALQ